MQNGLVLSGGGAKGSYQAGVIKALSELECQIDAISGASIGALNGAIITQAKNLADAADRLQQLWIGIAKDSPLKLDKLKTKSLYMSLLGSFGAVVTPEIALISRVMQKFGILDPSEDGLICESAITDLLDEFIHPDKFDNSIPLYVSVYQSSGQLIDVIEFIASSLNFRDNKPSSFIKIQDLPSSERINLLLASAAIPIIFAAKNINGKKYYDGGMGGANYSQGNTPIDPLLKDSYNRIYVSHLSDGSLWSRHNYDASIIEIRPQEKRISRSSLPGADLLGFSAENVLSWIEQGYDDTMYSVGRIKEAVQKQNILVNSQSKLNRSLNNLEKSSSQLDDAMKLLD